MARLTKWIVYVDKATQEKASALFDAVFAHFIKKEMDIAKRKLFMAQFLKANTEEKQFAVINAWVMVRDIETFPFRKDHTSSDAPEEDFDANTGDGEKESEESTNEDKGDKEAIPVDDGPDGEPE